MCSCCMDFAVWHRLGECWPLDTRAGSHGLGTNRDLSLLLETQTVQDF